MHRVTLSMVMALLSASAIADTDLGCMTNCVSRGMSWAYCEQVCTINQPQNWGHATGMLKGLMESQQFEQEQRLRQLEIQRRELELQQMQQQMQQQ